MLEGSSGCAKALWLGGPRIDARQGRFQGTRVGFIQPRARFASLSLAKACVRRAKYVARLARAATAHSFSSLSLSIGGDGLQRTTFFLLDRHIYLYATQLGP
jgi:hypothetical protein